MKKVLCLLLTFVLLIGMTACKKNAFRRRGKRAGRQRMGIL